MKYFIILILFTFNLHAGEIHKDFDLFLKALGKVESSGDPKAYNPKEKACGIYQVRDAYFLDAQQYNEELKKYKKIDLFNPEISRRVVIAYFQRYGYNDLKNGNWENLARLHNSGPSWKKKKELTNKYWVKVKKELDKHK